MKIKREHLILFFIFLVGAFIRVLLFRNELFIGIDGVSYARLGKNLIENGRYVFGENYNWGIFFPPGYPILIGIINLFVKDLFLSGKLISLFFSIIAIFLFYLIGKELYNKESGLFAAFVYAIHLLVLRISARVATEALFFFFLFLSIYLFIILVKRNNFFIYVLLGISIAISYLTRPEGILLLLLPFLTIKGCNPLKNKKQLFKIGVSCITFILIASPYMLFIKNSIGKFAISGKAIYLPVLLEGGVKDEEIMYDKTAYSLDEDKTKLKAFNTDKHPSIVGFIIKKPFTFIQGILENSKKALKVLMRLLAPIIFPLFFVFFSKDLFKNKIYRVLLIFSILFFVIYPSFFILEKLIYPTALFLVLFSSVGFVHSTSIFSDLLDYYDIRNNKVALFMGKNIKYIIIILCIFGAFRAELFSKREFPVEHMKAGYFLKNNVSSEYEKLNIMHRVPWVSFYSDSRFTMMPYAHYIDVINFAKLYKVDFIVVDERSSLSDWEFYNELLNMDKYTDDVELIYEDNSEKLIKLFKVRYK